MIFQTRVASAPVTAASSFQPPLRPRLQRKCACGSTPGPTGECEECKRKRLSLQTKLVVNQPSDKYEQEADRVAEAVVRGGVSGRPDPPCKHAPPPHAMNPPHAHPCARAPR
jgi:hypothetical protein